MTKSKRQAPGGMRKDDRLFTLGVSIIGGPMTEEFVEKNEVVARTIQIRGDQTLEDLHYAIFEAFDREEEHMYEFQVGGKAPMDPKARSYVLPMDMGDLFSECEPSGDVTGTTVGSIGLRVGEVFGYWFDFGDDWWHRIDVVEIADEAPPGDYPTVTSRVGESPPQYIDWDEDEELYLGETDIDADPNELAEVVSESYVDRFLALVELTDGFCDAHLDAEYRRLCRLMAAAVCCEGLPVLRGKPSSWAAGIVYALGRVNFLTDPSQTPHMTSPDIAAGFGVSPSTMMSKAKVIREEFELIPFDPRWCLPSLVAHNPLVWLIEVDGFLADARLAPRDVQVVAYEKGLIPFIPADHPEAFEDEDNDDDQ